MRTFGSYTRSSPPGAQTATVSMQSAGKPKAFGPKKVFPLPGSAVDQLPVVCRYARTCCGGGDARMTTTLSGGGTTADAADHQWRRSAASPGAAFSAYVLIAAGAAGLGKNKK